MKAAILKALWLKKSDRERKFPHVMSEADLIGFRVV